MRWTATLGLIVAGLRIAAAQPAPAESAKPAEIDPRNDAAWQLYHEAFAALLQGDPARARAIASALLRDYPDHAATRRIRAPTGARAPGSGA